MKTAELEKILDLPNASLNVPFSLPLMEENGWHHFVCADGMVAVNQHFASKVLADREEEEAKKASPDWEYAIAEKAEKIFNDNKKDRYWVFYRIYLNSGRVSYAVVVQKEGSFQPVGGTDNGWKGPYASQKEAEKGRLELY